MEQKKGRTIEYSVDQANHTPGNAIPLPNYTKSASIRCHPLSANNTFVGVNGDPTDINLLQPGDSVSYGNIEGVILTDAFYIGFDPAGSNGRALVSITFLVDVEENYCPS